MVHAACCLHGLPLRTFETALTSGHSCLASCCPQSRLQTGMQGAFGKPQHAVARVHTGQVITSICTKLQNKEQVIKAPHRAKFKFLGPRRSTSPRSGWIWRHGGRKVDHPGWLWVKYIPNRGPPGQMADPALMKAVVLSLPYSRPPINPTFLPKTQMKKNDKKKSWLHTHYLLQLSPISLLFFFKAKLLKRAALSVSHPLLLHYVSKQGGQKDTKK